MKPTYNFLIILTLMLLSNISYSQSVPSYVPTNGLVGWWGFNGNAQDGSGNGNHGTVNGATLTTDRFGNQNGAYDFDGMNDFINVADHPDLRLVNTNFTLSTWYKVHSFGLPDRMFISKTDGPGSTNKWILMKVAVVNGGPAASFHTNGILGNFHLMGASPENSDWHQLIVRNNGGVFELFEDAVLIATSSTIQMQSSNLDIRIGGDEINGGGHWHFGKLDDIGIWNRALTQQEITNLYNSQLPTQTSLCLPTITTTSPSSVAMDSVVIGGNITNDGGSSSIVLRGVCYSTSPNPNMGNSRTEDGSGIGSFNTVLRGLNPSTTYYARSYAKNSNGVVVYGNEVSFTTSSITIGSNFAGGIVFYIDSTGQHGLVCAPSDQGNFQWGCYGTGISGTSTAFGTGMANTLAIVNGCSQRPIAASVCNDLVLNGYNDWYLPSRDELSLMYQNLWTQSLGNFYDVYWSSSQGFPGGAAALDFRDGLHGYGGSQPFVVRAVRAF